MRALNNQLQPLLRLKKPLASPKENITILWGDFTRPRSLELVESELTRPLVIKNGVASAIPTTFDVLDMVHIKDKNPFYVTNEAPKEGDFFVGDFLPDPGKRRGKIPSISEKDATWFDDIVAQNKLPQVFVIGGHQVISEGWHNDAETNFMFLPTLLKTIKHNANAQKIFANVKVAILFGCNTMTNLEPHQANGEYMSPEEIKALYYSGPEGKRKVIGSENEVNTLEFYRSRLAREYGPGTGQYEYTRDPAKEVCRDMVKHIDCAITYLDRILPDEGLFEGYTDEKTGKFVGYHDYNYPYKMSLVFPNAKIILGFSSASPAEELRVKILAATFSDTYKDVSAWMKTQPVQDGKILNNILYPLISDKAPVALQRAIVMSLRKNWTTETYKRNSMYDDHDRIIGHRISGSISPVFPDLEQGTILGASFPDITNASHQYGPYAPKEGVFVDAYPGGIPTTTAP